MKTMEEIIELVRNLKKEIERRYNAEIIGIFGSYARGEQREGSDVDILVKFHKGATLFDLVGLSIFLEEKLGIPVDVVSQNAVKDELKERIYQEVVRI